MKNNRKIKEELASLLSLRDISRMYAEIAASRMKRSRQGVITTRDFLNKVQDIFNIVHRAYLQKISQTNLPFLSSKEKITFISHNGKKVIVLLSSNTGLYGDITRRTLTEFINDVKSTGDDIVIIGRFGLSLFLSELPRHPYTYFDLPDNNIDESQFGKIIKHLVEYDSIRIHYPKFESVINQSPSKFEISATTSLSELKTENVTTKPEYIFEPTLEKLLAFFESQMFTSLMEQTVRESQLAKFAARILAMDRAFDKISNQYIDSQKRFISYSHRIQNKKQLESLVSLNALN